MWKFAYVCVLATAPMVTVAAQSNLGEISVCRGLHDDQARLRCYDRLMPPGPETVPSNEDNILFQWSGTGMTTTKPFRVKIPWELQWNSNNLIQIYLYKAGSSDILDIAANQRAGKGSSYQPEPGEYYMKVNALGAWKVRIVAATQ